MFRDLWSRQSHAIYTCKTTGYVNLHQIRTRRQGGGAPDLVSPATPLARRRGVKGAWAARLHQTRVVYKKVGLGLKHGRSGQSKLKPFSVRPSVKVRTRMLAHIPILKFYMQSYDVIQISTSRNSWSLLFGQVLSPFTDNMTAM